jgi:dihydroorotase
MPTFLLTGGRVIDPASGRDGVLDVAVEGDRIAAIGAGLSRTGVDRIIQVKDLLVVPGLIDPTFISASRAGAQGNPRHGSAAAVQGGFTTVCCMPNTSPALDTPEMIEFVGQRASQTAACRIFATGAITKGRRGEETGRDRPHGPAGAVGFTDDGDGVASAGVMARALGAIKQTGGALMQHCQEPTLTRGASMHAGEVSTRLGLTGWPRVAEETMIERDIRLNRAIGCRYHVQHISSATPSS